MSLNFFSKPYYLIKELTKRDISSRYKGNILGISWLFITPIAMLAVFTFVFGEIFKAKWPGTFSSSGTFSFALNLYIGLSIFWYFSDVIAKAPTLIISVPNYVKKVVFPLEILPVVSIISASFFLLINIILILIVILLTGHDFHVNSIFLIIVLGISIPMLLGISLGLSALGVYVRDISSVIGVFLNMLMFLSPIFYPLEAIPQNMHWLFELNPLTLIIEESRQILLNGSTPRWSLLASYLLFSACIFLIGLMLFKKLRKGFSDVI